MSSYYSYTVQVRRMIVSNCFVCGRELRRNPYIKRTMCRLTCKTCKY